MSELQRILAAWIGAARGRHRMHTLQYGAAQGPGARLSVAGYAGMAARPWPSFHAFAPDTPDADGPSGAQKPPRSLRRFLGGKIGRDEQVVDSISERLRALRHGVPERGEPEEPSDPEPARQQPRLAAEIVFTAGPRAGERLQIQQGTVALDRDAQLAPDSSGSNVVASIWPQGTRFMLRHNGGILVGGARPALSVVTLDDGDELAWGAHRMRFSLEAERP